MNYTIKSPPAAFLSRFEPVDFFWIEKKDLIIENENGEEFLVRMTETGGSISFETLVNEDWVLISDIDLLNWLFENVR